MPRDSGGTYTLPTGNPVVTQTTITSTWANNTMNDLASEITNSLDRQGRGGMQAAFRFADGSTSAPGMTFVNETNLGFNRSTTGQVTFNSGGTAVVRFDAANNVQVYRNTTWYNVVDAGTDQTFAGNITFSLAVTIPETPTAATDAASKGYVDSVTAAAGWNDGVATLGGNHTASGNWTFSNVVIGATPTLATHLTTKAYVDGLAGLTAEVLAWDTANFTTAPTASGTDSLAIGDGTTASSLGAVSFGLGATAGTSNYPTAVGASANVTGLEAFGGGYEATVSGTRAAGFCGVTVSGANAFGHGDATTVSGNDSIGIGAALTVTGDRSVGLSSNAAVTSDDSFGWGNAAVVIGNNGIALGAGAAVLTADSVSLGRLSSAARQFEVVIPNNSVNVKNSFLSLRGSTTNATPTEIKPGGGTGAVSIPSDGTVGFVAYVSARRTDVDGESAFYKLEGAIDNNAGTTALVGAVAKTIYAEDTAAWDVAITADDAGDKLVLTVTGEAGKTIQWLARIDLMQASG